MFSRLTSNTMDWEAKALNIQNALKEGRWNGRLAVGGGLIAAGMGFPAAPFMAAGAYMGERLGSTRTARKALHSGTSRALLEMGLDDLWFPRTGTKFRTPARVVGGALGALAGYGVYQAGSSVYNRAKRAIFG